MGNSKVSLNLNGFWGFWLLMFLVIKVGGTALAGWSWWWLLLPIVPDLVVVLRHFGMLSS